MQQINQEEHPDISDQIDLRKFTYDLLARKLFISVITVFFTLIAIIYTYTLSPVYITNVLFKLPYESSVLNLNQLPFIDKEIVTKESLFTHYLKVLSSKEFRKNVFIQGNYLAQIDQTDGPIGNTDSFIDGFVDGLEINPPKPNTGLIENPYTAVFRGDDPVAITKYLNGLIGNANMQASYEIGELIEKKRNNRLFELASEIEELTTLASEDRFAQIQRIKVEDKEKTREILDEINRLRLKEEAERTNEIIRLRESAKLAKSLGVIDNNFKELDTSLLTANFSIDLDAVNAPRMNHLPDWFLYGEKALLERIEMLEKRIDDDPFIPELINLNNELFKLQNNNFLKTLEERQDDSPFILGLSELNAEKATLESLILDTSNIKSIQLIKPATVPSGPIPQNKGRIIFLGFLAGFLFSIFLILVMNVLKPNEKNFA